MNELACPKCISLEVDSMDMDCGGDSIRESMVCGSCGEQWINVWEFSHRENISGEQYEQ